MRAIANFPGARIEMPNRSKRCLGVAEIASRKAGAGFLAKRCKLKSLTESDNGLADPRSRAMARAKVEIRKPLIESVSRYDKEVNVAFSSVTDHLLSLSKSGSASRGGEPEERRPPGRC